MSIARNVWHRVAEDVRTYVYADGVKVKLRNVIRFKVSEGGRHYVQTETENYHIMQKGWKAIHIEGSGELVG